MKLHENEVIGGVGGLAGQWWLFSSGLEMEMK